MDSRIVVVDNDRDHIEFIRNCLAIGGFKAVDALEDPSHTAALTEFQPSCDVAIIKIGMPNEADRHVLEAIRNSSPSAECILLAAFDDMHRAFQSLRTGAYDCLIQPVTAEVLISALQRALERKRLLDILNLQKTPLLPALTHPAAFQQIVTSSRAFLQTLKEAEIHAAGCGPILITGEGGTGKKLLANAIHAASSRAGKPFMPVNMESYNADRWETEFFGRSSGTDPETRIQSEGYLARCQHGTLFLSHIESLSLDMQGDLLEVLEAGAYTPHGANIRLKADVRFIAGADKDLDHLLQIGRLRKDLFYRIRGGWLHILPLRERSGDIRLLIDHFLRESGKSGGSWRLEESALDALVSYDFPGNVAELRSIIHSAAKLARGLVISVECLPAHVRGQKTASVDYRGYMRDSVPPLMEVERRHILSVYQQMDGNKVRTARALGIGLNTLRRRLKAYETT